MKLCIIFSVMLSVCPSIFSMQIKKTDMSEYKEIFKAWNIDHNQRKSFNFYDILASFKKKINKASDEDARIKINNECKVLFSFIKENRPLTTMAFFIFLPHFLSCSNNNSCTLDEFLPHMLTEQNIIAIKGIDQFFKRALLYPQLMNNLIYVYNIDPHDKNLFSTINKQLRNKSFLIDDKKYSPSDFPTQEYTERTPELELKYLKIFFRPKSPTPDNKKAMTDRYFTTLACLKVIQKKTFLKIPKVLLNHIILPRMLFPVVQKNIIRWIKALNTQENGFATDFLCKKLSDWYFNQLQSYFNTFFLRTYSKPKLNT